ncbi:MAG: class I SAM-dependent RNA methyltransferase [Clostridia bacterium]|nr:class I SAM-dependent RNA methyltransferase [Clostridia bacterium]
MTQKYVATCLFGLEKLLGNEIDSLGYKRIETMDGRITFEGDEAAVARANINLRFAERVFILVGEFPARSFTELFDNTALLPWECYIGKSDAFPVKGHAIKSTLFSVPDCQSIVKKAIVGRLSSRYGIKWFEETGVKYQIEFFIFKDIAHLMIDTSGTALHKRGYRPASGAAPLRETLAAAVAATARPREDVLLWDPFCGSGTIAIEAAMMMTNRAPGIGRTFAAQDFPSPSPDIWKKARDEAVSYIRETEFEAWGSDIDRNVLEIAKENARRAGVDKLIHFFECDARKLERPDRRGTIVCNPPYGERLMEINDVEDLYRSIGEVFRAMSPWQVYVLTSHEGFERLYGKRADKIRKLYNGMIPCNLYQYFLNPKDTKKKK